MNANLMTKKIEMTKTEAKAAGKIGSEEFDKLRQYMEMYPGYEIQKKQADGAGAMISFVLNDKYDYKKFFEQLQLITLAESLGGIESLVCHPATMTHAAIPADIRKEVGIVDELIRLSVGIEDVDDLIEDLKQAIENSVKA